MAESRDLTWPRAVGVTAVGVVLFAALLSVDLFSGSDLETGVVLIVGVYLVPLTIGALAGYRALLLYPPMFVLAAYVGDAVNDDAWAIEDLPAFVVLPVALIVIAASIRALVASRLASKP